MKLRESLFLFKAGLLQNYKPLLLSLLISCLSFPAYDLFFSSGLDNALPWVFNYFADGHLSLGRNTLFPHGPLAFLIYPLPMHNNLGVCTAITFFCSVMVSFNLFRLCRVLHRENHALVLLVSLIMHAFMDIQLLLIALTLSQALLFHFGNRRADLVLALLFCVFNLFIKAYGGILCGLIVAGLALHLGLVKKQLKTALAIPALFLLFFYLFWLGLYGSFGGSLTFLRGQYELSSDNSEAVALYADINWLPLALSLISLAAIPLVTKDPAIRYACLLMLLPFFAGWKHAMARADEQHVAGFLNLLLFFFMFIWALHRGPGIWPLVLGCLSFLMFVLNMAETGYSKQKNISLLRPYNLYNLTVKYNKTAKESHKKSKLETAKKVLPDTLLKMIGKNTVDVYPWNYSIVAVNGLNWIPRPVLHSYASYTHWLDQQNAKHISSANAARFVIWETTADDYQELQRMSGIDNHYLLNDGPISTLSFFSNYSLKYKTRDYLLYERRQVPPKLTSTVSEAREYAYNQWIDVPDHGPGKIVRAKLDITKSFAGRLKSFFFKGEEFYIYYEMEDRQMLVNRIVPKNAKDGLWINPHVLIPENNYMESRVKRIKITCEDTNMVAPKFSLAFESITYTTGDTAKDNNLQKFFFNKYEKRQMHHLSLGLHQADSITDQKWLQSLEVIPTTVPDKPGESYYTLKSLGYTGSYALQIDSIADGPNHMTVRVNAKIKTHKDLKAVFVISHSDAAGQTLNWWPRKLNDPAGSAENWSNFHFLWKVSLNHFKKGHKLQLYFWNADKQEACYLDDVRITIEGTKEH
jgi:hypothetical protein